MACAPVTVRRDPPAGGRAAGLDLRAGADQLGQEQRVERAPRIERAACDGQAVGHRPDRRAEEADHGSCSSMKMPGHRASA